MNSGRKISGKLDIGLIVVTVGLALFGVLMVYSASSYNAEVNYGNEFFYMYKQIIGVVAGVVVMFGLTWFDYRKLVKLRWVILGVSILLLALVLIPGIGVENYGARRWLNLGFITLQSSEVAKFGYIIFVAAYLAKHHKKMTSFITVLPIVLVGLVICVLIMLEPNMSVTMCVIILMLGLLFIGGMRMRYFVLFIVPVIALVMVLIIVEPYRLARLMAFINPWASPLDEGYQLIQSYYALGSGGFFGLGLFNSRQKFLYLPFSESDFIFSVIGEELGFLGCLLTIAAFCYMIFRLIRAAQNAADRFGCYLCGGIAMLIGIQVLINIAVVTGSIPPTGIPLPFISAGSSSLIVFCGGIGIAQSVNLRSHASVRALY